MKSCHINLTNPMFFKSEAFIDKRMLYWFMLKSYKAHNIWGTFYKRTYSKVINIFSLMEWLPTKTIVMIWNPSFITVLIDIYIYGIFFFTDSKLKLINLVKSCKFFCKICPDLFVDAVVAAESVKKKILHWLEKNLGFILLFYRFPSER